MLNISKEKLLNSKSNCEVDLTPNKLTNLLNCESAEKVKNVKCIIEKLYCAVCAVAADGQHFGANACRACAAFFRRTIARRLRYICRFDNDCEIQKVCRSVCRSCRLAKCYQVGMNSRAVRSQVLDAAQPRRKKLLNNYAAMSTSFSDNKNFCEVNKSATSTTTVIVDNENNELPANITTAGVSTTPFIVCNNSSSFNDETSYYILKPQDKALTNELSAVLAPTVSIESTNSTGIWSHLTDLNMLTSSPAFFDSSPSVSAFSPMSAMNFVDNFATINNVIMPASTSSIQPNSYSIFSESPFITTSLPVSPLPTSSDHASNLSSTSSSSSMSLSSAMKIQKKLLYDIVEINAMDYFVDVASLPPTHPTLFKMLIGYEGLQRRRDVCFSRSRESNGLKTRIFIERQVFDVHQYWKNIQMEVEWVAEMLSTFDGYRLIRNIDKVHIFKHYWIHFIILERSFDSYRVLGPSTFDLRMVFANGDINDVVVGEYDTKKISDMKNDELKSFSHPWFCSAALEILAPLKKLEPTEVEMMFCLGIMFWRFTYDVSHKISDQTRQLAEEMTDLLYNEINAYYSTQNHVNFVKRVAELMRLIGITEKLVLHRKEDIVLQRTFKTFKVDLYMEEIFDTD